MKLVFLTEDGYRFWEQEDGTFGDGDLIWNSFSEFLDYFQGERIFIERSEK